MIVGPSGFVTPPFAAAQFLAPNLGLHPPRPATGVSRALRAQSVPECPSGCLRRRSGPGLRSVQRVSKECPQSVRDTFLTLRGRSRDTLWTLRSPGPERRRRHPEGHSRDTSGPKGPRDSCSRSGGGCKPRVLVLLSCATGSATSRGNLVCDIWVYQFLTHEDKTHVQGGPASVRLRLSVPKTLRFENAETLRFLFRGPKKSLAIFLRFRLRFSGDFSAISAAKPAI